MKPLIRTLATIVATLFLAVPFAPKAQTVHTVGVLMPQSLEQNPVYLAFLETLNLLGYQEGANLRILSRSCKR